MGIIKTIRKVIVTLVGLTFIIIGVALIFLPGPAFIIIPIGVAILSLEFKWAKNLLAIIKTKLNQKRKDGLGDISNS